MDYGEGQTKVHKEYPGIGVCTLQMLEDEVCFTVLQSEWRYNALLGFCLLKTLFTSLSNTEREVMVMGGGTFKVIDNRGLLSYGCSRW